MTPFRDALARRLEQELGGGAVASAIVEGLDDGVGDEVATSPLLDYQPPTLPDDKVASLWVLAFGYRLTDPSAASDGAIPPMEALAPGPVNEALAHEAAAFVGRHRVPIVAQWEVAGMLVALGVDGVISVEPDHSDDGDIVYLSTAGVIAKGLRLATDAGITVGEAGLLAHADHAVRCVMTANAAGMRAAVPRGVRLPSEYDLESGQPWTRRREDFIPLDLMGRTVLV